MDLARLRLASAGLFVIWVSASAAASESVSGLADGYLDRYFRMFPTRATAAGRHDLDRELEDLSAKKMAARIEFNRTTRARLLGLVRQPNLSFDDKLDGETLLAQIERELNSLELRKQAERDPLLLVSDCGRGKRLPARARRSAAE